MFRYLRDLRVSEQLLSVFSVVWLLFFWAAWQYYTSLEQTLNGYRVLQTVFETKKSSLNQVARSLSSARQAEKDYLLEPAAHYMHRVNNSLDRLLAEVRQLDQTDEDGISSARVITELAKDYRNHFKQLSMAFVRKGMDHNVGMQGRFRNAVHQLEAWWSNRHSSVALLTTVLQIRRREKDYLLRHEFEYVDMVRDGLQKIGEQVETLALSPEEKTSIESLLELYKENFFALVEQNRLIAYRTNQMQDAAERIVGLVDAKIIRANWQMSEQSMRLNEASSRLFLSIILVSLGGFVFLGSIVWGVVRQITNPLKEIDGFLARATQGDTTSRLDFFGERNEVYLIAQAINLLLDDVQRSVSVSCPVTARKEADARLHTLIHAAAEAVIVVNTEGCVQLVNQVAEKLFGYPAQDMVGEGIHTFLPTLALFPVEPVNLTKAMLPRSANLSGLHHGGGQFPLLLAIGCFPVGKDHLYLLAIQDLSWRENVEESLEKVSKEKTILQARINHEIRTLLNKIIGSADLLLMADLPKAEKESTETILYASEALLRISDEMLGFTKIALNSFVLNESFFRLQPLLTDISHYFSVAAREKGLHLRLRVSPELPDEFYGNMGHLRQILVNLVSNAVKFSQQGEIVLEAEAAWEENVCFWLRFVVHDSGHGFDEKNIALLHTSSVKLDVSPYLNGRPFQETQRPGLGLAVVRKLLDAMGGEVCVDSQAGQGSRVTILVPLKRVLNRGGGEAITDATLLNKKCLSHQTHDSDKPAKFHLLIVENDRESQILLQLMLERMGGTGKVASNGEEALRLVQEKGRTFDLILMDCQMPIMDGLETTRQLRRLDIKDNRQQRIPVVALTAKAMEGDRQDCLDAGMDDYMAKPVRFQVLQQMITKQIATF